MRPFKWKMPSHDQQLRVLEDTPQALAEAEPQAYVAVPAYNPDAGPVHDVDRYLCDR